MDTWATFWTWFLVIALTLFFGLAIVVAVGGAYDIRALFQTIRTRQDDRQ